MRNLVPAVLALFLAACGGSQPSTVAVDPAGEPSGDASTMPTEAPAPKGEVTGLGTVLESPDQDGPEFCLGGTMDSLPPQCGGPALEGWDWAAVKGHFEQAAGTRWGSFALTGSFDGATFTITRDPIPAALYDTVGEPIEDPFKTRCSEPGGGWRVLDPAKVDDAAHNATVRAAQRLDGFGGLFVDNSPGQTIVNVLVTGDPAAAEAELRKVWGGPLCVSPTEHTEAERRRIQEDLVGLPGMISAGAGLTVVEVRVVYDDGSLQAWADEAYGEGLVAIASSLEDAG